MSEELVPFDRMAYEMAIRQAPPDTMIKFGDLEPVQKDLVRCTTCDAQMEPRHAQYHKHPKKCGHCHDHFDENTHRHVPVLHQGQVGAGTIGFTRGCKPEAL